MKYLRDQIDKMIKPNDSTKALAKVQSSSLHPFGRYGWIAMETRRGEIQFRNVTPVSTMLVTVQVMEI
jgi:hypothetical protein